MRSVLNLPMFAMCARRAKKRVMSDVLEHWWDVHLLKKNQEAAVKS